MRKVVPTLLVAGALAVVSASALYARARTPQPPEPRRTYEACHHLALSRGLNVSKGDRRNLEDFIYQCMIGKIPF